MSTSKPASLIVTLTFADGSSLAETWRTRPVFQNDGMCPAVHGKPSVQNLTAFVAKWEATLRPGNINAEIGTVVSAKIVRQATHEVLATYPGAS